MSLPILSATNPTTVPAIVYDKWWIQKIEIQAPSPNHDASANIILVKFATNEDGIATVSNETVAMEMNNLLSNATNDPELAMVIGGLMNYIMKVGQNRGIVAAESI
jgi:hypothetical protein